MAMAEAQASQRPGEGTHRTLASQVLLQCGVLWLSAPRNHCPLCPLWTEEETERFADPVKPRDPERRPHHKLAAARRFQQKGGSKPAAGFRSLLRLF